MLKTFIERPALSTVISIIIVLLGLIGLNMLPIERYPNIAPPRVLVQATYGGANADVMMNSVVIPLEEAINGVENMSYMTSTTANGRAAIQVYFALGTDPDMATVNVQNRVSQATSLLPQEVIQSGITVRKQQNTELLRVSFGSDNPAYDETFLQNYAQINILPQLKRIPGVSDAISWSIRDYSMRLWLKPDVMASYGIATSEVLDALRDQNIEAAPGIVGENSGQTFQYTLKYAGRLNTPEQYEDIIVRSGGGRIVRLGDIADIELGAQRYDITTLTDGSPAIQFVVLPTQEANSRELINTVKSQLEEISENLPQGVRFDYLYDFNDALDASISQVLHTLVEAFLLVFLVVFVFLQNGRATLIPAIAVPVAVVGTFFFLWMTGISLNMLTLFALVLAIGIVVDDAIVVVEAVYVELERGITDTKEAAIRAMKEIAPAIVSITLIMASVFLPMSFTGTTAGVFMRDFGLTLASAIFISAVNALTLSPALCALFLKPQPAGGKASGNLLRRFFGGFDRFFSRTTDRYRRSVEFLTRKGNRWITAAVVAGSVAVFAVLSHVLPTGFVPDEDNGNVTGVIYMPPGTSLLRTDSIVREVSAIAREIPDVAMIGTYSGRSTLGDDGSSYGTILLKLKHWDERELSVDDVVGMMYEKTRHIRGVQFIFQGMPTLPGFGMTAAMTVNLQDRTGGDMETFYDVATRFIERLKERDEILTASTSYNPRFPQKQIVPDMARIRDAGLTLDDVMGTLQMFVGGYYASDFNRFGKLYRVMMQAAPEYRETMDDLDRLFVRTPSGEMTPVTEFFTVREINGSESRSRFNLYSSIAVTVVPNYQEGYSTGEVLRALEEVRAEILPAAYSYEFSGLTREEAASGNQMVWIFGLSLLFVYLLLVALYESYILPLAVLCSLPVGLAGVYVFCALAGISNNVYVQLSMIMLIGLLGKNAVLIVEYAVQRRRQGQGIVEAAVNGATARLRPILMTSFAFIVGLLPLTVATGAGAVANHSIGVSAVGGMLVGVVAGVLVSPVFYVVFQNLQERFAHKK